MVGSVPNVQNDFDWLTAAVVFSRELPFHTLVNMELQLMAHEWLQNLKAAARLDDDLYPRRWNCFYLFLLVRIFFMRTIKKNFDFFFAVSSKQIETFNSFMTNYYFIRRPCECAVAQCHNMGGLVYKSIAGCYISLAIPLSCFVYINRLFSWFSVCCVAIYFRMTSFFLSLSLHSVVCQKLIRFLLKIEKNDAERHINK